tara:strand:- start:13 stop:462 length:450 start_codon:yes stop_codon:yes gene_type:complete
MGYIGNRDVPSYHTIPATQRFSGDGSDVTFTLNKTISNVQDILVSVDGVIQDTSSYTIPNGTTLTFDSAPSAGTNNIFVNFKSLSSGSIAPAEEMKGNFKHGGLFRTNAQRLSSDVTIAATENANCTGPLIVDSGVNFTLETGCSLVIL